MCGITGCLSLTAGERPAADSSMIARRLIPSAIWPSAKNPMPRFGGAALRVPRYAVTVEPVTLLLPFSM